MHSPNDSYVHSLPGVNVSMTHQALSEIRLSRGRHSCSAGVVFDLIQWSGWQGARHLHPLRLIPLKKKMEFGFLHHICLASTQSNSSTLEGRPQGPSLQGKYSIICYRPCPVNHGGENMVIDATAHLSQVVKNLGGHHQCEQIDGESKSHE